ncbi:MAG: glutamyl-tRNA amidotransferase [Rhodobacteraceae bacterium]|nr:glutamyl-tRNA amidotransferase [Paracoccaceae bacterium]MBR27889.1 glutamyl-tRNA amidotransferase [Paracoccaceae bacterium]
MKHLDGHLAPGGDIRINGAAAGPLKGLSFMAKDLFDVAGHATGAGNPDWALTHPAPKTHAWVVARLLDAGADLTGKTITDEISLGLLGENAFEGTPLNPAAPDRVPGGSSSGSASAVAQGLCDTALGTDTGGSVRVPSSFCGLYGIRTTHGRVNRAGMLPQAPGSDTIGWMTRDAATFARVSAVLLDEALPPLAPAGLVVAEDAFDFAAPAVTAALRPAVDRLASLLGGARADRLAPHALASNGRAQRALQLAEAWETFGPWVTAETPRFSYLVARTLMFASSVPAADIAAAALVRDEVRGRLARLTADGAVICLPTTPDPAPRRGLPLPDQDRARDRINALCAHGGLAGHPQISLPLGKVDGAPVGLSLIAARGEDMKLAAIARALEETA